MKKMEAPSLAPQPSKPQRSQVTSSDDWTVLGPELSRLTPVAKMKVNTCRFQSYTNGLPGLQ